MNDRGQGLLIWAVALVFSLAMVAVAFDGSLYFWHKQSLQYDLDVACVAAGNAGEPAFWTSLIDNGVGATATINPGPEKTYLTTAQEAHTFYLAQVIGVTHMELSVQSRCLQQQGGIAPLAVQEPWYLGSFSTGDPYPILGSGVDAVDQPGNDFPGAILTQLWCLDGAPCDDRQVFEPIPQDFKNLSCQPYKDVASDTITGIVQQVYIPVGTHIPHVAGVSNNKLVKAGVASGWTVGTELWVAVFDGTVYKASQANCDN